MFKKILFTFLLFSINIFSVFASELEDDVVLYSGALASYTGALSEYDLALNSLSIGQDLLDAQNTYSGALALYNLELFSYSGVLNDYNSAFAKFDECWFFCGEEEEAYLDLHTDVITSSGRLSSYSGALLEASISLSEKKEWALESNVFTGGLITNDDIDILQNTLESREENKKYEEIIYHYYLSTSTGSENKTEGLIWLRTNIENNISDICSFSGSSDNCSEVGNINISYGSGLLEDLSLTNAILTDTQNDFDLQYNYNGALESYSGALESYSGALENYNTALISYSGALADYKTCVLSLFSFSCDSEKEEYDILSNNLSNTSEYLITASGVLDETSLILDTTSGALSGITNIYNLDQDGDTLSVITANLELAIKNDNIANNLYYEDLSINGTDDEKMFGLLELMNSKTIIREELCGIDEYSSDCRDAISDEREQSELYYNSLVNFGTEEEKLEGYLGLKEDAIKIREELCSIDENSDSCKNAILDEQEAIINEKEIKNTYNEGLIGDGTEEEKLEGYLGLKEDAIKIREELCLIDENSDSCKNAILDEEEAIINEKEIKDTYNEGLIEDGTIAEKLEGYLGLKEDAIKIREELCLIDENSDSCKNAILDEEEAIMNYDSGLIEYDEQEKREIRRMDAQIILDDASSTISEKLAAAKILYENSDEYIIYEESLKEQKFLNNDIIKINTLIEKNDKEIEELNNSIDQLQKLSDNYPDNSILSANLEKAKNSLLEIQTVNNNLKDELGVLEAKKGLIDQNVNSSYLKAQETDGYSALQKINSDKEEYQSIISINNETKTKLNSSNSKIESLKNALERIINEAEGYENSSALISSGSILNNLINTYSGTYNTSYMEYNTIKADPSIADTLVAATNNLDIASGLLEDLILLEGNINNLKADLVVLKSSTMEEYRNITSINNETKTKLNSSNSKIESLKRALEKIIDEAEGYENSSALIYNGSIIDSNITTSETIYDGSLEEYNLIKANPSATTALVAATTNLNTASGLLENLILLEGNIDDLKGSLVELKASNSLLEQLAEEDEKKNEILQKANLLGIDLESAEKKYKRNCESSLGKTYIFANTCFKEMCKDSKNAINSAKTGITNTIISTNDENVTYISVNDYYQSASRLVNKAIIETNNIDYQICSITNNQTGSVPVGTNSNTTTGTDANSNTTTGTDANSNTTTGTDANGNTTTGTDANGNTTTGTDANGNTTTGVDANGETEYKSNPPRVNCIGLPGCVDTNISKPTPASKNNNLGIKVVSNIIGNIIQFVAVIAVIALILSGILYLVSGGEEEKVKTAKSWITWSLVGVILSISAWGIIEMLNKITIG